MATTARPGDHIEITAVQSYEATWDDALDRLIGLTGVLIAVNDSHLRENERTGTLDCAPFEVRIDRDAGIEAGQIVFAAGVRLVDAGMQEPAPSMSVAEAEAALAPLEAKVRAGREAQQTGDRAAEMRDRLRGMALSLATGEGPLVEPWAFNQALDDYRDAVLSEPTDQAAEIERLRAEAERMRHELEVMYGGAFDTRQAAPTGHAAVRAALREAADHAEHLMDQRYGPDCSYGIGGMDVARELRRLADEQPTTPTTTPTADPIPLRWGLDDIEHGDDDTVTVLLSGPDGRPYWLELNPERANALREALADPEKAQQP